MRLFYDFLFDYTHMYDKYGYLYIHVEHLVNVNVVNIGLQNISINKINLVKPIRFTSCNFGLCHVDDVKKIHILYSWSTAES
jgi:hypothetical protein